MRLLRRLFRLAGREPSIREDLDAELELHRALATEELIRLGHEPEAARRLAERQFGDFRRIRGECARVDRGLRRARWRSERIGSWLQDVAYTLRSVRRSPGFFAVLLLTLSLGIALNSVVIAAVDALLVRPIPIVDPDRTVELWHRYSRGSSPVVPADAVPVWRRQTAVFERVEGHEALGVEYSSPGESAILAAAEVTSGLFAIVDLRPKLGRVLIPDDFRPGAPPAVMISNRFWLGSLGGDPAVLDRSIVLDGVARRIVGITPPGFGFPNERIDAWLPMRDDGTGRHQVSALAVFRGDLPGAKRAVEGLAASLNADHPRKSGWGVELRSVGRRANSDVTLALEVLAAAVVVVLLVACVNAANLMLFRGTARRREFAIRLALGASRGRVLRQVLTESILLAMVSGGLALAAAGLGVRALAHVIPTDFTWQSPHGIVLDTRILFFTATVTIAVGFLFGLLPAWRASRAEAGLLPVATSGGSRSPRAGRLRHVLLLVETGLSTALLIGAGLFIHNFVRLTRSDLGMDAARLAVVDLQLSKERYPDSTAVGMFFTRLAPRLASLPGVTSVTQTSGMAPRSSDLHFAPVEAEGTPVAADAAVQMTPESQVDERYFRTVGTPLIAGRDFAPGDAGSSEHPVILNRTMAERLWPGQSPLGKRFRIGAEGSWNTVIGIARDLSFLDLDGQLARSMIYAPGRLESLGRFRSIAIRTSGDPAAILPAVRGVLRDLDPLQVVWQLQTAPDRFAGAVVKPRFLMLVIGLFAAVAVGLALVGIYGVIAYSVQQRTAEFGIRMAIGASGRAIVGHAMRQGVLSVGLGILGGIAGAWALARVAAALLAGVPARDPVAFLLVPGLVLIAGLAACYLPARRAARIDPTSALRAE